MRVASDSSSNFSVCDEFEGRRVEGSVRLAMFDRVSRESDVAPLATEQTVDIVAVPAGANEKLIEALGEVTCES